VNYNSSDTQPQRVTVIIPHKGSVDCLCSCISAVRAQTYPQELTTVIVVMNEPERDTLPFNPQSNEMILWQPKYFSYAARNHGIRHSEGDVIAFTDSDTIPNPNWLAAGIEEIKSGADLVAGKIELGFSTNPLSPSACYEKLYAFDQEKNARVGVSTTANLFVTRKTFDTYGLFDEHAATGEDFEWTGAVTRNGGTLVYEPGATVSHPARETWAELVEKSRRTVKVLGKHKRPVENLRLVLERLKHQILMSPSPSKKISLTPREYSFAVMIRFALLSAKAGFAVTPPPPPRRAMRKDFLSTDEAELSRQLNNSEGA